MREGLKNTLKPSRVCFSFLSLAGEGKEELSFGETRVVQSAGAWGQR